MPNQSIAPKNLKDQADPKNHRRIEDLIDDAEIEAEAEIDKSLRNKNTKIALISLVSLGLLFVLYKGIEEKPEFLSALTSAPTGDSLPDAGLNLPKPIPFPLMSPEGGNESMEAPGTPGSEATDAQLETPESGVADTGEPGKPATEPAPVAQDGELTELDKAALKITQALAPSSPQEKPAEATPAPAVTPPAPVAPAATAPPARAKTVSASLPSRKDGNFLIQLGAFSVKGNADRMVRQLESKGWSPYIEARGSQASRYLVYIGGFSDARGGQSLLQSLKGKGLKPVMHKNEDGTHSILLGQSETRIGAEAIQMELTQKGILSNVKQAKIDSRIFVVRVAGFGDHSAARSGKARLEALGYKNSLIVASAR